jgi:uncharacterized protein
MPRGDGTGPGGQGPGTGQGRGLGRGISGRTGGRGRMGGSAAGLGGECICPSCKTRVSHQPGVPCFEMNCPKCGAKMVRG